MAFRGRGLISGLCDTDRAEDQSCHNKPGHSFRAPSCQGVGHLHCVLAETLRQAEELESFTVGQREALCAQMETLVPGQL